MDTFCTILKSFALNRQRYFEVDVLTRLADGTAMRCLSGFYPLRRKTGILGIQRPLVLRA
jgi:hypothetical protein